MHRTMLRLAFAVGTSLLSMPTVHAQSRSLQVDAVPSLRIGATAETNTVLSNVAGATRLPDGSVLVGDRGDFALLLFDAHGKLTKSFGRKGKGPGEIGMLFQLRRCGNAFYTSDLVGERVSEFRLDGTFVRAFRFAQLPYRASCNSNGQFFHMGWEKDSDTKEGAFRPTVRYWMVPADSTPGKTIAMLAGSERNGGSPLPLGKQPRVAMGADRAYIALADSMYIRVFDLNGRELPAFRAPVKPVAVTDADLAAEFERDVAMVGEKSRASMKQLYANAPRPKCLPATRDMIVDTRGNLWVQHFPRAGSPTVPWTVFDKQGKVLATTNLPAALEVFEIGDNYVLGAYVDPDNDVTEVRVYPLKR